MYLFGKTPMMILGTTALIALGGSAVSAEARTAAFGTASSTTAQPGRGKERGFDIALLAAQLGVSQSAPVRPAQNARTLAGATR